MKELSAFIISFCIVCSVVGGLGIIFPSGKMKKSVEFISVIFIIASFLGIFCIGFKFDYKPSFDDFDVVSEASDVDITTEIFKNALKNNNVDFEKMTIIKDKNEFGSIVISKVILYTKEPREKIMKIIGNGAEYEVEVIND
ncbi:MAG: hypothetical protein MJ090_00805 [Clostridia bacterium]|nr:hypothetical protein [Clostridia bacterium]